MKSEVIIILISRRMRVIWKLELDIAATILLLCLLHGKIIHQIKKRKCMRVTAPLERFV